MNNTKGKALWTAEFLGMSLSNFLIYITQYAMIAALPIVIMTEYGGDDVEAGLAMTFFQIGTVVARPFVGRIFDRKGPDYTVYPGLVLFAAGMFLLGDIEGLTGLIAAALLLGAGFGAVTPALQTLAVRSAPPARAGVATATYFWSLDISVGLAAAGLGIVAVAYGYAFTYSIVDVAVIAVGALCYAVWRRSQRT